MLWLFWLKVVRGLFREDTEQGLLDSRGVDLVGEKVGKKAVELFEGVIDDASLAALLAGLFECRCELGAKDVRVAIGQRAAEVCNGRSISTILCLGEMCDRTDPHDLGANGCGLEAGPLVARRDEAKG